MAVRIDYTKAERMSFKLVPETCPAVEGAIDAAFAHPNFQSDEVAAIFAKYRIVPDRNMVHALYEVVGKMLFARKRDLLDVVLYEGTFPLRAALVRQVELANGMAPDRNHFEEWVADGLDMRARRAARVQAEQAERCAA